MFRLDVPWWLPGSALLLFGILIAIFPELLSLLVASTFIFAGVSLLAGMWSARRFRAQMQMQRRDEYRWFV
jgi:predicted membrane protein